MFKGTPKFSIGVLHPEPVLLIDGKLNKECRRFIVAADLHLGSETRGIVNGPNLNSKIIFQNTGDKLISLIKSAKADGIILLGDIKSNVSRITRLERDCIPPFLTSLSRYAEVYIVPGNHDGLIRYIAPKNVNLISSSGMLLGDILFIHGHTMPSTIRSSVERIVMGHLHPILLKPNNIVNGQRVWIYMKVRKKAIFSDSVGLLDIIIMPSFDVGPGAPFGHSRRKIISPILDRVVKNGDIEEMLYLTLDGSIIADLASLGDMPF